MDEQAFSTNEIEVMLLNLTIEEIASDPSLAKAKEEIRNLLSVIKRDKIAITASQLTEKINQIRTKYESLYRGQR